MDFMQFYVDVNNDLDIDDDDNEQVLVSKDGYKFIYDSEQIDDNDVDFYREFENVIRNLNEPINDHEDWLDKRDFQPENYPSNHLDRNETKFDEFDYVKARNKKFRSKILIYQKCPKDLFFIAVLSAFIFKISKKFDFVTNESKIEATIGTDTHKNFKK